MWAYLRVGVHVTPGWRHELHDGNRWRSLLKLHQHCRIRKTIKVDERQNEDYVSLHAIQIKGLQCTERSRREVYQKNSELLKDWEESFLRGKNPDKDPDSQIEDISNLKLMSKMEYFSSTQLYHYKVIRGHTDEVILGHRLRSHPLKYIIIIE